ncbi:MAG: hypothetical protein Kow00121_67100 [Elainellaceae cyanobacterium]
MKLNRLVLLSIVSSLIAVAPISAAIAQQATVQTVAQSQPVAIATGTFVAGEAPTTGTARIVTVDGHHYLELDAAFSTSNMGPDLHVLLDSNQPPQSYENLGGTVNLGSLSEFSGTQLYPIPDAIDVANYGSVVIWCRMANATFGYAQLNPVRGASL